MKPTLYLRIAGIAVTTLALTMLTAALLTAQLIRVEQRQELDQVLRRELTALQLGLPEQLNAATGGDGTADAAEVDQAVQRYLALHPGSEQHLTIIRLGPRTLSTRDGPPELEELQRSSGLPSGTQGRLLTVDSPVGPLRVLSADVISGGQTIAQVSVLGPLSRGWDQAREAFIRIGVASAIGLTLGGLVLLLALRQALHPIHDLATAARSVDLTDLSSRVPEPGSRDEVASMAAEFNRMLDRIRDDERRRQQLLSAISHELRTPLAVAHGHLELLETLGPDDTQSAAETAAISRRELDRLGRIVDDLTAINRGQTGARQAPEPVFAPDVTQALQQRLVGLNLDDVDIRPAPPVVLLGDEDRLTQALLNLVVNARTHTPPGTPVVVDALSGENSLTFRVRDSGPGIDPAIRAHVFEPFVTTKSGGSRRTSGLGLTVVKAITEAQGGTVTLTTDTTGTTVSLTLALDNNTNVS
jgi:two-component system, OmpR family, sensor kinase